MTPIKLRYYTRHKLIWYRYDPDFNVWDLSDDEFGWQNRRTFNADMYRIDQCLEIFEKELIEWYKLPNKIVGNGYYRKIN